MPRDTDARWVSDDVWAQIAADATGVDAHEARVMRRSALGVLFVLVVAVTVWMLGLVSPRLDHGNTSGGSTDESAHTAEYEIDVINRSWLPATMVGISVDVPGVVVTSTTPSSVRVPGGSTQRMRVTFHIPDCTAAVYAMRTAGAEPPLLHVAVSRPWGEVTTDIQPPTALGISDLILMACGEDPSRFSP